jgi:hypothetical protein
MGKVDEEYEAKEDEEGGPNQSHIISPEHEEAVRDKEGDHDEDQPDEYFWSPPAAPNLSESATVERR